MSTMKKALGLLESERQRLNGYPEFKSMVCDLDEYKILRVLELFYGEISDLQQQVASLSTKITSATSNSGTETEDSPLPTGERGSLQAPFFRAEPAGKTE